MPISRRPPRNRDPAATHFVHDGLVFILYRKSAIRWQNGVRLPNRQRSMALRASCRVGSVAQPALRAFHACPCSGNGSTDDTPAFLGFQTHSPERSTNPHERLQHQKGRVLDISWTRKWRFYSAIWLGLARWELLSRTITTHPSARKAQAILPPVSRLDVGRQAEDTLFARTWLASAPCLATGSAGLRGFLCPLGCLEHRTFEGWSAKLGVVSRPWSGPEGREYKGGWYVPTAAVSCSGESAVPSRCTFTRALATTLAQTLAWPAQSLCIPENRPGAARLAVARWRGDLRNGLPSRYPITITSEAQIVAKTVE